MSPSGQNLSLPIKPLKIIRKTQLIILIVLFARCCPAQTTVHLDGNGKGKFFDGIGGVNAGGGVGRLLINYPEPPVQ